MDQRESILKEHPDWTQKEKFGGVSKIAKERWEKLDPLVRKRHEDEYKEAMVKYKEATGKLEKQKDLNAPKKPMQPYFAFTQQHRDAIVRENPQWASHKEKFSGVAAVVKERFAALPDAEKERLTREWKEAMEKWKVAMAEYKKANPDTTDAETADKQKQWRAFKMARRAK